MKTYFMYLILFLFYSCSTKNDNESISLPGTTSNAQQIVNLCWVKVTIAGWLDSQKISQGLIICNDLEGQCLSYWKQVPCGPSSTPRTYYTLAQVLNVEELNDGTESEPNVTLAEAGSSGFIDFSILNNNGTGLIQEGKGEPDSSVYLPDGSMQYFWN